MFSENNRISGRQGFRLLTYDLLGLSTLLVPTVLAGVSGTDGIFGIGLGIAAALLFLKLLSAVTRDMNGSYTEYLEQRLGVFPGKAVQAGYLIYFLLLAGYTAYLFSNIVLQNLLREESFWLVVILLLLLAGYGLWGGIEGRARVYELLFWFIMIPLFFMLFSALDEVKTDYWTPVAMTGAGGILAGGYYVFVCFSLVFLVLYLSEYVPDKTVLFKAGRTAVIFAGAVHAILYLILLGIFGSGALAQMQFPAVTLMSTVRISGGFLKRADAFMFAIWFFTLYAILNSMVFYGANLLKGLTGILKRDRFRNNALAAERLFAGVSLVLVFFIAAVFYQSREACEYYELFLLYIGTPFLILVPVILALCIFFKKNPGRARGIKKGGAALCILITFALLSGCNTPELEDRNFPIEAAIDDTEEFAADWLDAENAGSRVADYSHLKVIIIGRQFLEDEEAMEEFLDFFEKKTEIPRNAYLAAAENAGDIVQLSGDLGESVGTYLEELFENVSEIDKKAFPTLGAMYQEKENRQETLFIPFIKEADKKPALDHFFAWKRGKPAGDVDQAAAQLAFFTEGDMESYMALLKDAGYVRLFEPHHDIAFQEEQKRRIVVNIRCSGEMIYQKKIQEASENTQKQEQSKHISKQGTDDKASVEEQVEAYMNRLASQMLKDRRIDVSNSFKKLGGHRRAWYQEYEAKNEAFEEDMEIEYHVTITWVNL